MRVVFLFRSDKMKRFKKAVLAVGLSLALLVPSFASAYQIDKTYQLAPQEGSSQVANNRYVVLHEIGVDSSSAKNNAIYMKRNWNNAYTQFIVGDGGKIYQVGTPGYVAWGAGTEANANAPVQIELARTWNTETFKLDYKAYIDLARDQAQKYGIPLTLDSGYGTNGVKSHLWVTQNIWGDHVDPYGYLSRFGITKAKLAQDLANGVDGTTSVPEPEQPVKPEPTPPPTNTGWVTETGTFCMNTTINIRTGASTGNSVVGQYYAGESVVYDSYKVSGGYVWIHYTSWGGQDRYMAIRTHNGTSSGSLWGTIY